MLTKVKIPFDSFTFCFDMKTFGVARVENLKLPHDPYTRPLSIAVTDMHTRGVSPLCWASYWLEELGLTDDDQSAYLLVKSLMKTNREEEELRYEVARYVHGKPAIKNIISVDLDIV